MKKILSALLGICLICSLIVLNGCSDTFITNNYGTGTIPTAQLEKGFIFAATQPQNYSEGAIFWVDNNDQLQTDLGSGQCVLKYRNDERNTDIVIFTVLLPGYNQDTLRFIARNSKFRYDLIPDPGDSTYPFRGIGIVNTFNYFFVYDQERNVMHFFNAFNGHSWSLPAVYDGKEVLIEDGQKLLHNSVSPNPLGTNVHEWYSPAYVGPPNQQITAYRPIWRPGGDFKNPGHIINPKTKKN